MNLPKKIEIVEVGPRDGFQNIKTFIPTDIKLEIIDSLIKSNFHKMEITSFVNPKAVPQMSDAAMICETLISKYPDVQFTALTPNLHGAKNAYAAGLKSITYVISASEEHNKANVNRTIQESLSELELLRKEFQNIDIQLDVATAYGCPFHGKISIADVLKIVSRAVDLKVDRVCLCDTIGIAAPDQVERTVCEIKSRHPAVPIVLHLHDTRGMGLSNVLTGIQNGVDAFEASVGGLGGCPFAPGASGNIATEDMANMLESMGIETGINIENLIETARLVKSRTQTTLSGHLSGLWNRPES